MLFKQKLVSFFALLLCVSMSMATPASAMGDIPVTEAIAGGYADWQIVGPEGGDVRAVAIDPRDKDRVYISTLDGQVHKSVDGGRSWRLLVNLNKPGMILDQLIVDSRDSEKLYTSGHRHISPGGFFRSTDGGASWKEAKELRNESIHAMTQSTADPNYIYVGSPNGVFLSKNSGADWEKISSTSMPANIDAVATDPRNTSTIYVGTWYRPYKTTDGGKNWRLIKSGMIDDSDVFAVEVDPRNPEHIISSACSGIYESWNGGEKWSKIQGIPSQSRRTRDMMQHPTMPEVYYVATTEGFWMSTNGGKAWALTTQRNLEINSIAVHPDEPNRVFIGTNNHGVMVSTDGGRNFLPTNQSFTSRFTYSITPDIEQPNRLYAATHNTAAGGGFFFSSMDGGRNWQPARNLDINRVRVFAVRQDTNDPMQILLGTNIGIFRSMDRGITFTQLVEPKPVVKKPVAKKPVAKKGVKAKPAVKVTTPAPPGDTTALVPAITEKVNVLEVLPQGGGYLAGTEKGIYHSRDLTKGWERLPIPAELNTNIFAVHISAVRPDTIWAGTATTGVIVSRDLGKTWTRVGGAIDGIPVSSIMTDPKRPDYVYVGTVQTFYVSRDDGRTWDRRGGRLPLGNFTSILINPVNTNEILLSSSLETDGGVYISSDAGKNWKRVDTEGMRLASRRVWSMVYDPHVPGRIFAATHSSGVYKIERPATVSGN